MKYEELGQSKILVSKLALGTWALGGGSVWTDRETTVAEAERLLDTCKDYGINYLDTAPVYGTGVSEELLGKALKGRRQDWVIQSKCSLNWRGEGGNFHYERDGYTVNNDTSYDAVKKDVEGILKRMQLDYLDSVIVHYVCHSWPEEETVAALEDMIKEGKIRCYGLSNSQPADLTAYCEAGKNGANKGASLVQEFFSVLSPFHGRDYFETCKKYGATFQTYGVLEEGFLTGPAFLEKTFKKTDIRSRIPWVGAEYKEGLLKAFEEWSQLTDYFGCSYANLVEAWAMTQYDKMSLLVGMRRPESVKDNVKCMDLELAPADVKYIEDVVKNIQVAVLDK